MRVRRKLSPKLQAYRDRQTAAVRATIAAVERRRNGFVPPPASVTLDSKMMAAGDQGSYEARH